ncbi:acyltransferase family protein [Algicella marina]|uniref:acyltransferase family protein n=1 Tax=Algicella marina TaxID=2683284 RepID=UPI001379B8EB|nr:acyltransferase [Algicella marina]
MAPAQHDDTEIVIHTSLRGIAALCVVVYHVGLGFPFLDIPFRTGFAGHSYLFVDLFFLLSGYIICIKYRSWFSGGISVSGYVRFMALRFARIYPNFLLWVFIPFAVVGLAQGLWIGGLPPLADLLMSVALHILMMQSVLDAPVVWNTPLWSIPVEMVSYALFPLLTFVFFQSRTFALICACIAFGIVIHLGWGQSIDVITGPVAIVRGLAGFTIGGVLALFSSTTHRLPDAVLSVLQASALLVSITAVHSGYEVTSIAGFICLVWLTQENRGVLYLLLGRQAFHTAGIYSFSVYLAHTTLIFVINLFYYKLVRATEMTETDYWATSALALVSSLIVGRFCYHHFELPTQKAMRARMVPRRETAKN